MAWIIKVQDCYLGDRDSLVVEEKEAHRWHYKMAAKEHAQGWAAFRTLVGKLISYEIVRAIKK